jgi:predicted nucleic acid-binding protein
VIVVDTSAIVDVLLESPPSPKLLTRISAAGELHAPQLIDVEFLSVLRRLVNRGELTSDAADVARELFAALPIERYPHGGLADRAWALRHQITAYDAVYVALSEQLALPLVTADVRLANSSGHFAVIESYAR